MTSSSPRVLAREARRRLLDDGRSVALADVLAYAVAELKESRLRLEQGMRAGRTSPLGSTSFPT
jgi:hypothetical protein